MGLRAHIHLVGGRSVADNRLIDALSQTHRVTLDDGEWPQSTSLAGADLLLVGLRAEGGDDLLRALEDCDRHACIVVLDRGASQRQLAEAFRLGAQDCLSPQLDASLAAERVDHLCRRILADRSHALLEGVR